MNKCDKSMGQSDDDAGFAGVFAQGGLVNGGNGQAKGASALFDVGVVAFPYLADHGFQDMIVLPGSFYIELALRVHSETLRARVGSIHRIEFRNPVILSPRNVTLSVEATWLTAERVHYVFREVSRSGDGPAPGLPCATLEIECDGLPPDMGVTAFSAEAFQQQAVYLGGQGDFYLRLRENGNQYGPHFQNLRGVWRSGDSALGRLQMNCRALASRGCQLDPVFLDGVMQLLSGFFLDQGRTFILQGVEALTLLEPKLPEAMWVQARLRPGSAPDGIGRAGDLEVLDDAGRCLLRLAGVRFTYMDHREASAQEGVSKTKIVIASTFTAEPVEDSLQFWGDYLGFPVQVSFAPYNQVFQELLNPASQLRRNREGINVILLNLGDWAVNGGASELKINPERAAACFGNLARHVFPNGLEVAHLNRHETEYVYQEIFEDRCYLRHGIRLAEDATVIDIGANIGLFSLFVRSHSPQATVYAFEPSPATFRALKANCEAYGPRLHPFNVGVSERRGSAVLTFYDKSSVFSSFHPSAEEDRQAIQAVVANVVRNELGQTGEPVDEYVEELMSDRLDSRTFECPLISVSDIIRDHDLRRVNLLKVDAEKCELEIFHGIEDALWPLIDQVVVEIHDRSRRAVDEIQALLFKHGFQCAVEEERLLAGSGFFNVYAIRPGTGAPTRDRLGLAVSPVGSVEGTVDQFVQALDSYARAVSTPTILCLCPPARKDAGGNGAEAELAAGEHRLVARVGGFQNLEVIGSEAILTRYPTSGFYDPHSHDLGHVPYTPEGFAAIGSSVFRKFAGLRRLPYKVIVLDCDNTLWQGVCGEDGPLGVVVAPGHRALHTFMIRQMKAGKLVCLCSKNNEEDVWSVFEQHPGMALKREHFAAWRINWSPKSENLAALSRELKLGLDSFIFLDDNPVECAEVRAQCPEVLTLQLPSDPKGLEPFLEHVWAFDPARTTEEDRTRTQKVLENVQRERYRGQVSTLKDFIAGLQLQVTIFEPAQDHLGRISQLTLRTNQFNFTTIRRSEVDIERFLGQESGHCLAAQVRDRFGDYGMVGLLLYRDAGDRYEVDTFLLSCRVLGRGVEHQILAHCGRLALEHGKQWVNLRYEPTAKNRPAWEFIQPVGAGYMREVAGGTNFQFPAAMLAGLHYDPDLASAAFHVAGENGASRTESTPGPVATAVLPGLNQKFQQIAGGLNHGKAIYAAIEATRLRGAGGNGVPASGELPAGLAGRILGIWQKILGNPRMGMNDNFVEAGGTSLKAVQIVAAIRRELQVELSIVNIFECPTVLLLSEKLEPGKTDNRSASEAMERGARRKQRARRRA